MKVEVLSLFPELFSSFFQSSLIGKAQEKGIITLSVTNIRDFASPPHFSVDDAPYGGGAGMVMRPEPLAAAIEAAQRKLPAAQVILLSPAGAVFTQKKARSLSQASELILVCGRYEGIDQRVIDLLIDEELSIGDYVLMGGEIPAMVVIEATTRLISSVIGNRESIEHESFEIAGEELLEAPHYTRPPLFRDKKVPDILLSGDHGKIAQWRKEEALKRTKERRPDLLKKDTAR